MPPTRWDNCRSVYKVENIKAVIRIYPDCGHEQKDDIKDDIVSFFRGYIND